MRTPHLFLISMVYSVMLRQFFLQKPGAHRLGAQLRRVHLMAAEMVTTGNDSMRFHLPKKCAGANGG